MTLALTSNWRCHSECSETPFFCFRCSKTEWKVLKSKVEKRGERGKAKMVTWSRARKQPGTRREDWSGDQVCRRNCKGLFGREGEEYEGKGYQAREGCDNLYEGRSTSRRIEVARRNLRLKIQVEKCKNFPANIYATESRNYLARTALPWIH